MIRAVTTTEVEWDEETRTRALALDAYRRSLCPCGCGFPASVSQAPDNEDRFDAGLPYRCHVRTAIAKAAERLRAADVDAPEGLLFAPTLMEG